MLLLRIVEKLQDVIANNDASLPAQDRGSHGGQDVSGYGYRNESEVLSTGIEGVQRKCRIYSI